ncbi:MAG: isoleucine--tRNA ligase [Candidatus Magasanikbacteria bacterium]
MPYNANEDELKILKYWEEKKIFEKSVLERPENKPFVFYDGPPFATGLPHYGHIVASLIKDVVPRYFTMKGFRVERKWGWDCHGLPIENIIEKDLGLKSKKEIDELGIDKFNEACRSTVLTYAEEWKKTIRRMGRFVDMENAYKTMDIDFMESVWWVFKELWDKDLIYEGKKAMQICPHCVTPLANFEVTQGYKDIKDLSATVKFRVVDEEFKDKFGLSDRELYILAWTTTPWTLPGNVLLATGKDIDYVVVKGEHNYYLAAKELVADVFQTKNKCDYTLISTMKGEELVGVKYEPLFPYFANTKNAFKVVVGDFVTTEEGTGIVHIAPAFGDDDYKLGEEHKVGWVQHVEMNGHFTVDVLDFADQEVKPKDDHTKTDVEIIKWLAHNDKLFCKEKYEHSYPHCWRCDTPLLNYATSSWFVKVTEIKDEMLRNNKQTNWVPDHIKDGRFGLWLEGARDWAISRNRYWGSALPIWRSEDGYETICIGSVAELEELSGQKVEDLHKHILDKITFEKDGKKFTRIPEVLDCWFESGAMPYGQMHYPFENKEKFESGFPAEFIAEGQDQTRGWFYTLHVLATALTIGKNPSIPKKESVPAFKNVIVNGIVLAEDGKKMSKRLKNYPDPMLILEKYGADALRYYFVSSPVMYAESLNFVEKDVREVYNKVVNTLWNVYSFFSMFNTDSTDLKKDYTDSKNILDKWILAKLHLLLKEVTENMEKYKLAEASRPILDFITELSQWYVRRSRDRFKQSGMRNEESGMSDRKQAVITLHEVLLTLSKIIAPFTPFMSEKLYQELGGELESVHLEMWPKVNEKLIDKKVLTEMETIRKVVETGLSVRAESGIKVRQVLSQFYISGVEFAYIDSKNIIAEELNVKEVLLENFDKENNHLKKKEDWGFKMALNTHITEELKKEGLVREIVRTINQIRKEQGMTIADEVIVEYYTENENLQKVFVEYEVEIKKSVLARELVTEKIVLEESDDKLYKIDGMEVMLSVKK